MVSKGGFMVSKGGFVVSKGGFMVNKGGFMPKGLRQRRAGARGLAVGLDTAIYDVRKESTGKLNSLAK